MVTVGTYEAKTHLPKLLERVSRGESITITRHGKPIARLVPISDPGRDKSADVDLLEIFRKFRKKVKRGGPSIRELINEGRRR